MRRTSEIEQGQCVNLQEWIIVNQLQPFSIVFFSFTARFRFQGREPPVGLAWAWFHPVASAEQNILIDHHLDYLMEKWSFPQGKPRLLLPEEGGMDTKRQKQPVATWETWITPRSLPSQLGWGERVWSRSFFCTVTLYKEYIHCCIETITYTSVRDSKK